MSFFEPRDPYVQPTLHTVLQNIHYFQEYNLLIITYKKNPKDTKTKSVTISSAEVTLELQLASVISHLYYVWKAYIRYVNISGSEDN